MKPRLTEIFVVFFIIGLQLLGGGFVILPLIRSNLIEKRNWISEEELIDYFSLSQCLPGLIAANVSVFTGYKIRKISGALAALLGVILPAFLSILLLAAILIKNMNNPLLQNIFWGIRIGVLILIALTVKEILDSCIKTKFSRILYVIVIALMLFTKISPEVLIIMAGITSLIKYKIRGCNQ